MNTQKPKDIMQGEGIANPCPLDVWARGYTLRTLGYLEKVKP